jgi:pyruvate/2-oxoglutarate dehydrogenase complex dihydrolipoamide dehydrogenase (E3) component
MRAAGDKMKHDRDADLCVIGGGSAGLSVAIGAAQLGARVVLIERGQMGGECLNTPATCRPSRCWSRDAQSLSQYVALLSGAAFTVTATETHNSALADFVSQIRTRLLAAEVMARLQKLVLPGVDFEAAKSVASMRLQRSERAT